MVTASASEVRAILDRHGLRASRDRGQCFLVDSNVIRRIAEEATRGGEETVVEIGPGLGALTRGLLELHRVLASEAAQDVADVIEAQPGDEPIDIDEEALETLSP